MKEFDYKNKERRWERYHMFEREHMMLTLRRLSFRNSVNLLRCLYGRAHNLTRARMPNKNKIETIIKMHSLFGRIKI